MSKSNEPTLPLPALHAPRTNRELITFARRVHDHMLNNPHFPSPAPTLAVFAADIDAFEDAEAEAASRAEGTAAFRDKKKKRVYEDLFHLRTYVQRVVETDATPDTAAAVIESAFMSIKKVPARSIPAVSAKNGDVSGKVRLAAKAAANMAVYYWEHSMDQSTWTPLPQTTRSRTEVSALTPGCVYHFRFRAFTRAGWQDNSQVVSLLVI